MSAFGITGVQSGRGGDGSVPLRLEIRQLQQNADQWNLYLLALDRLQNVNQTELLSWYQISGIHGRPHVAWDNVQATPGDENSGYCTHSSILFPTWHRPYLALYEQVLYGIMQRIVGEFPAGSDRDRYSTAASTFRIPYWDWAAAPPSGQSVLPASVGGSATVQVTAPTGTTTIKNPLFSYTFHPLDPNELPDSPFNTWPSTLRYPTSSNDPKASSQNDLVSQQLDNNRLSFRNRLYNLFTAYPNYANFSNKAWIPNGDGGNYDSIESVHDQIHGLVGSGGHMSIIDYSAFDPIFYLHHCNVDRAFAIWQAIYADSYVEPEATQWGTFTNAPGLTEDVNTALTPFHTDGSGAFWNSGTSRNISTFGYSYPELLYWKASNQSQYQATVRAAVNNLYGNSAPAAIARRTPTNENINQALKSRLIPAGGLDGSSDEKPPIMVREQAADPTQQDVAGHSTSKDGKYREWIANIRVKKYALNTSFFIHVFLGDFNPDPFQWSFEPNLVGTHCIFVNDPNTTHCGKCKRDQANDLQVTGAIPLTTALLAAIHANSLASLDPADVDPYLKTNLHWRVTRLDDTAVPTDQVPDLKVSVVSSVVQKATSDTDFPRWGDFTVHDDVTDSRPAGLCTGEPV